MATWATAGHLTVAPWPTTGRRAAATCTTARSYRFTPDGRRSVGFLAPCPACGLDTWWTQTSAADGTLDTSLAAHECPPPP